MPVGRSADTVGFVFCHQSAFQLSASVFATLVFPHLYQSVDCRDLDTKYFETKVPVVVILIVVLVLG